MPNKQIGGLSIAEDFHDFIVYEALAETGVSGHQFWTGLAGLISDFGPRIRECLKIRDHLQNEIDQYHRAKAGEAADKTAYEAFLRSIGYLVEEPQGFVLSTRNVDDELAKVAGPQLVVPASQARYAINAVNARWASLYDALYGSNLIDAEGGAERGQAYNKTRGAKVIERGRDFLDETLPLASGSHKAVTSYAIEAGALVATLESKERSGLKEPAQCLGYQGSASRPSCLLLRNNGLHIEIKIDRRHPVGRDDAANIADIILESALTAVIDFDDTVAIVDPQDKVTAYRNWLGLMKGSLRAQFKRDGRFTERLLALDRRYTALKGEALNLSGRSLMLVRNSAYHMETDAVLDAARQAVPETILDAAVAALIAMRDLTRSKGLPNSAAGSIYLIQPKLHGPAEVALANELFTRIEDMLGLPASCLKMGLMDAERRTSLNLKACLQAATSRVILIDTDFRNRAADEIHTSMEAGPVGRLSDLKTSAWAAAYETAHIAAGLAYGLWGRPQIAKGFAAADPAWIPSPKAVALQALRYHQAGATQTEEPGASLSAHLTLPISSADLTPEEIAQELDENCRVILGLVVQFVDQGAGSSKASDAVGIGHLEDRATLRFLGQHIANWLHHGRVSEAEVTESLRRMADVVDSQNKGVPDYRPVAPACDGPAFKAAADLIFKGCTQPNGYSELILQAYRREAKAAQNPAANKFDVLKGQAGRMERGEAFGSLD
jgi:malate synthase